MQLNPALERYLNDVIQTEKKAISKPKQNESVAYDDLVTR